MKRKTITCTPTGCGNYRISMLYRGRKISCITKNIKAISDYNADPEEKCFRNWPRKRVNIGYEILRRDILNTIKRNT